MYSSPIEAQRRVSHFFMAIDISKFNPLGAFKSSLQQMVNRIRSLPTLDGSQKMMVAGDPEKLAEKQRIISGIPMDSIKYDEFLALSSDFKTALMK